MMRSVVRSCMQDERDASQIASGSREASETRLDRIVHDDRDASRGWLSGGRADVASLPSETQFVLVWGVS